ncbi:MAG: tyrosine-protein phosphatase [Litorimonas sp.]
MSFIQNSDRIYNYNSIYNFRDFGGYKGHGGRAVRKGRLFRSAHLNTLNDQDHNAISELGIGLIVDLRHAPERVRQPSRVPLNAPQIYTYPDPPEHTGREVAPHEAFLQYELNTAEDAHGYMLRSYTARPHDAAFQKIFGDSLRFLAHEKTNDDAGILVHCAAGKDRTGTLCALMQGVLGVSREDIMADYMLTLEAVDIDAIIGPAAAMFSERYKRNIDAKALLPMFGVAPEFLEASLEGMGDINTYAKEKLGLLGTELEVIRSLYLESM